MCIRDSLCEPLGATEGLTKTVGFKKMTKSIGKNKLLHYLKRNFFLAIKSLRVNVQAKKDTINNNQADIEQEEKTDDQ